VAYARGGLLDAHAKDFAASRQGTIWGVVERIHFVHARNLHSRSEMPEST
jgi:hypothetical protein